MSVMYSKMFARRVPFQQALSLIKNRSVYLHRGFAFVPLQKLESIIVTRVRSLSLCLCPSLSLSIHLSSPLSFIDYISVSYVYIDFYLFFILYNIVIMCFQFRLNLSKALADATSHFEFVSADSRIGPLLKVFIHNLISVQMCFN